jgi:DNA repair protein SbcD/Mre11
MYDSSYNPDLVRVIHTGDLHIDSPLRGLERYDGAPVEELVGATRAAFVNLVDFALAQDVKLIVVAGDVFDGDWRDYNTGLFFHRQLSRLDEAGVRVVMVHGNHDAESVISRRLPMPQNTKVLSSKAAEVLVIDELSISVTGQSFATKAVTDDLTKGFPAPASGLFNIALLHTSADGRAGHEPYAPCKPAELALLGYDYTALGHAHEREVLSETPWITFCGNLQGRHIRETGAKGFFLIEIEDRSVRSVEPVDVDVLRWERLEIDAADATSIDEVCELFQRAAADAVAHAEGRLVAARISLTGESAAHPVLARDPEGLRAHICAAATEVSSDGLWIEKVQLKTRPPRRIVSLNRREDPSADLLAPVDPSEAEDELAALAAVLAPLRDKLPVDLRQTEDGIEIGSAAHVSALLPDVEGYLRDELTIGSET